MKVSTKGRYGLKAMVDLAVNCKGNLCVSLKSIAERQGISEAYLEQLMAVLKKNGFVKSIRGAQGGYILEKDLEEISVGDILRALEGPLNVVFFVYYKNIVRCARVILKNFDTKNFCKKKRDSLSEVVDSISLKDLADEYVDDEKN